MDNPQAGRGLRGLAVGTAAAVYGLIVVGAVVRSTGSGMGCGDHWPLCNGYLIPIFDRATFIEWSHRLAASVATVMLFSTTLLALKNRRTASRVIRPLTAASVLLIWQIILGAITVKAALLPSVVALHLGTALIIFAVVLYAVVMAFKPLPVRFSLAGQTHWPNALVPLSLSIYLVILTGAYVASSGAKTACAGWPLCNGGLLPASALETIHVIHRYAAGAAGLFVFGATIQVLRTRESRRELRWAAGALLILFAAQIAVGALNVLGRFPWPLLALHIALASGTWGASVVLAILGLQQGAVGSMSFPQGELKGLRELSA